MSWTWFTDVLLTVRRHPWAAALLLALLLALALALALTTTGVA